MAKICLNMIVRNERARISRCLNSLVKHIDCYCILDTGSTDGTIEEITTFFELHGIPGRVEAGPFENFEQARNLALDYAYASALDFDWIMLVDADMEFVCDDPDFKSKLHGKSISVVQRAGGIAYDNKRFLARQTNGRYRGVTHEYLDVEESGRLEGVYFIDHADGSNRSDKFERDIKLLKAGLEKEPDNARYWFYLAQSYREAGKYQDAADCYLKRVAMGGWDEEVHNAKMNYAHMMKNLGRDEAFIAGCLDAFEYRPTRAEPLYDLAKYYREKGKNALALLLLRRARKIKYPTDRLFVNEWVHKTGIAAEYSVAAFYDENEREKGFAVCDGLFLSRETPQDVRDLMKSNTFHYLRPLSFYCPSFRSTRIEFSPRNEHNFEPTGYTLMNPSVARHGDQLFCVVRTVNYTITEDGRYAIKAGDGSVNDSNPIHTRNYLARLAPDLSIETVAEIAEPQFKPAPEYKLVQGFEDMRLFSWRGGLWTNSCVREMNPQGWCEQVLARVWEVGRGYQLDTWCRVQPKNRQNEKNWMPVVTDRNELRFIYRLDTVIDIHGEVVRKVEVDQRIEDISGSSQLVPMYGGHVAVVHEARENPDSRKRYYQHRFVYFDKELCPRVISRPFVLHDKQIEFCAGLARHPKTNQLILSYGIRDSEAWLATVEDHEVWDLLYA